MGTVFEPLYVRLKPNEIDEFAAIELFHDDAFTVTEVPIIYLHSDNVIFGLFMLQSSY